MNNMSKRKCSVTDDDNIGRREGTSLLPPSPKRQCPETQGLTCHDDATSTTDHDHAYATKDSPRKLKKQIDNIIAHSVKIKRRLRASHKKTYRLKRKVASLQSVVNELKKDFVSYDCASILENTLSGVQVACGVDACTGTAQASAPQAIGFKDKWSREKSQRKIKIILEHIHRNRDSLL